VSPAAERRAHAAQLARRYFHERSVPLSTIEETFRDAKDPLIDELIDLAQHEPPASEVAHYRTKYWPHVAAILEQLDLGDAGKLPPAGRWSLMKVLGLAAVAAVGIPLGVRYYLAAGEFDYETARVAIFGLLAAVAFPAALRQYLKQRRRRSA
jgi:hypothetical protein